MKTVSETSRKVGGWLESLSYINIHSIQIITVYIYICHTVIVWVRFLWSCGGPCGAGPTRKWSTYEKDHVSTEMEQKQSKRNSAREQKWKQRDTASERVR